MVISFALCATFAFAQTKNVRTASKALDNAQAVKAPTEVIQSAGYTGSIFTKDDEIFVCDFSVDATGYTTGVIGANEQVDGTNVSQHTQTAYHAEWHRIADTSEATRLALAQEGQYPVTFDASDPTYRLTRGFASPTANAGLMIMTMQDQIAGWGGTGQTGIFNSWTRFDFSTATCPLVRVRIYQQYRAFNRDHCYIDYSSDGGTTWSAIEINISRVDVAVNSATRGFRTLTLPLSMGNSANCAVRVRWQADEAAGGAYGYYWMFDDFTVIPAPEYNITLKNSSYFEGFYQMMPQGLNVPVVWAVDFLNDGQNAQTNVTGTIYSWMEGDNASALVSHNLGTVASDPMTQRSIIIDPLGYYDSADDSHGWSYDASVAGIGDYASLPTTQTGVGFWYGDFSTDAQDHAGATTGATFDTIRYLVNHDADYHNGSGVWARDHGAVTKFSYYCYGLVSSSTFSGDPDATSWSDEGYGVCVSYVTGSTVPADWRILGAQFVPATMEGMNQVGSKFDAFLWHDSLDVEEGGLVFKYVNDGSNTYTVKSSDVISGEDFEDLTYETYGNYPQIFIPFPNQPVLEANSTYRIGYRLAEECNFAVATSTNYYYTLADSSVAYFRNDPNMLTYGDIQNIENAYNVLVRDPYDGNLHFFVTSEYPMIRLVVGPSFYVPKAAIRFECNEEEGYFAGSDYNPLCGTVDSVAIGYGASYYIFPAEGYTIDKVYIDGVETEDYEIYYEEDGSSYGIITLEDIQAAHTLSLSCKVGIHDVAGVSMRLQPNPATSNVNINLKGVSGNVNMALIDMSGRVVTTSQFNAENGTTINVSNLAKGAYFVRITNDKFSKVEKLIVR